MLNPEQQVVETDKVKLAGEMQFENDPGFQIDTPIVRDDSCLETQEYELKPVGITNLAERFLNSGDQIEFQYINNSDVYSPSNIYFKMGITVTHTATANDHAILTGNIAEIFQRGELQIGSETERIDFIGKADTCLKMIYCGKDWTESTGSLAGFYPNMNADASTVATDTMAARRVKRNSTSEAAGVGNDAKTSYYAFSLPFGLFQVKKYVKNISFTLRLFRESNNALFEHQTTDGEAATIPNLTINKISMFVPTLKVNQIKLAEYDQTIMKDYLLQYNRVYVERRVIPAGTTLFNQQISSLPALPSKAFIFFQDQDRTQKVLSAVTGAQAQAAGHEALNAAALHPNPMTMDNLNVVKFFLTINNRKYVPFNAPSDSSFANGDYALLLKHTLTAAGSWSDYSGGSMLCYENYPFYPILGFDLQANTTGNGLPELNKLATQVEANIQLSEATAKAYNMYIVYIFNTVMAVAGDTNVVRNVFG